MRNLFVAYMLPDGGNGNAIIEDFDDSFEIVSIENLRGIRDIVYDYVNHEDFPYKKEEIVIINWKWLPSSLSKPETKLNPGDRICSDCKKIWPNDDSKCPHCGNDVPF